MSAKEIFWFVVYFFAVFGLIDTFYKVIIWVFRRIGLLINKIVDKT